MIARLRAWARRGWNLATDHTGSAEAATLLDVAGQLLMVAVRAGRVSCFTHPGCVAVSVITIDGRAVAVCESCLIGDDGPGAAALGVAA